MNHASATLQDFEHPLQKHPLNFTNIKQGNTFYSLTETQSLDFLLDVAPTTPPHTSSVGVFDNRDEKGYVNADSTIAVDPVSEPLETSKTPSSCATNPYTGLEDPLQLNMSFHPSNESTDEPNQLEQDSEHISQYTPSSRNNQDSTRISNIQLELMSHPESRNWFTLRYSVSIANSDAATKDVDSVMEIFGSALESDAEREETEDGFTVISVKRSKTDFTVLDAMLRKNHRFCIFPHLPLESLTDRFRYRHDYFNQLKREYERYVGRVNRHPILGRSDEFFSFLGACKDGKSWFERYNEFLRDSENRKDDLKHRLGKNLTQWARSQASEATKELRKGLSLIFEGHHTKDVDSQESVLARMEKIDRYLKSLENGLVTANKALEQYVENRTNLSKVVESFEKCFRERSSQEGTRMGEIFSNVAQSLAKEAHPKSQGEEMLNFVLHDYSYIAHDARRILGERLNAYETYEKALSKYNEKMRKLETASQVSQNDNEKSKATGCSLAEHLDECRQLYEQVAHVTDSELRRFRLEYHLEMNRALHLLAYEQWKGHMDSGKSWERVFRLCEKQYSFLQQQISPS